MRSTSYHHRQCRKSRGQALVETAVIAALFVAFAVVAAVGVIDAGLIIFHKLKLQALALNAAKYAASLSPDDPQFDQKVLSFVWSHRLEVGSFTKNPLFTHCQRVDPPPPPPAPVAGIRVASVSAGRSIILSGMTVTVNRDPEFRTVAVKIEDMPLFGNFPLTHVICHGVFHGAAPESSFPVYRGAGAGSKAPLSRREAYITELVGKIHQADPANAVWEYPKVICDVPGQMVPGNPCPPPPPPP